MNLTLSHRFYPAGQWHLDTHCPADNGDIGIFKIVKDSSLMHESDN
ncbi:hypothetical protein SVI_1402 [Shewanella violacea DSS12]|uniref:Uncharacterized protein n=1 Tax=Shewanella violacea (strain JCM 10179 / CIP 106290 / LMG 19151 / DSS12) TaxID=637905 RepID=D4ZI74_SHEVD|nr:hypothetical protein SVI_1402 [Shewanella violacea DSS12]